MWQGPHSGRGRSYRDRLVARKGVGQRGASAILKPTGSTSVEQFREIAISSSPRAPRSSGEAGRAIRGGNLNVSAQTDMTSPHTQGGDRNDTQGESQGRRGAGGGERSGGEEHRALHREEVQQEGDELESGECQQPLKATHRETGYECLLGMVADAAHPKMEELRLLSALLPCC